MAQYIEAPGFSYDPLPMEQYVQFAKEQALAYEGSLNSAYEFLDKLPILDGGLRTEGWAQQLRQEYGSQVQKAIDNFVDTKDRRALARELSAISTRLKTDNDLLVNNYDARAAAPTMQLFQTQPNGANSFTRSGTMQPVNRYQDPETGEIVEENNFIQFQRGQTSLQDAERSYNDYVGAYDIINDTKFSKNCFLTNFILIIFNRSKNVKFYIFMYFIWLVLPFKCLPNVIFGTPNRIEFITFPLSENIKILRNIEQIFNNLT